MNLAQSKSKLAWKAGAKKLPTTTGRQVAITSAAKKLVLVRGRSIAARPKPSPASLASARELTRLGLIALSEGDYIAAKDALDGVQFALGPNPLDANDEVEL